MKKELLDLIVSLGIALLEYLLLEKFFGLRSKLRKVANSFAKYFFIVILITVFLGYLTTLLFSENEYYYFINNIPTGTMFFLLSIDHKKFKK